MEYMMGGNLEDCKFFYWNNLKNGYISVILNEVATNKYTVTDDIKNTWAKQIALGLNFIHSRNIMHRDLKPD